MADKTTLEQTTTMQHVRRTTPKQHLQDPRRLINIRFMV